MEKKDELIYDIIFGEEVFFNINLSEYVSDIYHYEDFVDDIKFVMKKSKITIARSVIKVDSKTAIWELKVKK